jgi:hypothetical protein
VFSTVERKSAEVVNSDEEAVITPGVAHDLWGSLGFYLRPHGGKSSNMLCHYKI